MSQPPLSVTELTDRRSIIAIDGVYLNMIGYLQIIEQNIMVRIFSSHPDWMTVDYLFLLRLLLLLKTKKNRKDVCWCRFQRRKQQG